MNLEKLKKIRKENVRRFTLQGLGTEVKIVEIHDGDTCDLAFYHEGELVRFKCRLEDVDAPELEDTNGELARDFFAWVCMGRNSYTEFGDTIPWDEKTLQDEVDENENLLYAVFGKFDEYGRVLVTLLNTTPTGKSINEMVNDYVENL